MKQTLRHWLFGLCLIALGITSCTESDDLGGNGGTPPSSSYLALGDSYTIGEGVEASERFPRQLYAELLNVEDELAPLRVIAQTGWRTDNLAAAIDDAALPTNSYDLVTLLIGVNDQFQGRDLGDFRQNLRGLHAEAERICKTGSEGILLMSIPDYSVTPFSANADTARIRRELDIYNETIEALAEERGSTYVQITSISRDARMDRSLLAADGLHPSGEMYARWVELLEPLAESILAR